MSPLSRIPKATLRFYISLLMALRQRVFLLSQSILYACSIEVGTSTPYLCDILLIRLLTADIILSRLQKNIWNPPAKGWFIYYATGI